MPMSLLPRCIRSVPLRLRPRHGAARAFVVGLALVGGLIAPLTACGDSKPAPEQAGSDGAHKLKAVLLVAGLTNDGDWNQVAREAVERLEGDGRIKADIREKLRDPATAEPVIREYATKGYDLVISHGDQMAEPVLKVA